MSDTELILASAGEELFHSPCVGALKKLDLFVWWEEMLSLRRFQAKLSPLFPAVKKMISSDFLDFFFFLIFFYFWLFLKLHLHESCVYL